jgi:hypothetical protein
VLVTFSNQTPTCIFFFADIYVPTTPAYDADDFKAGKQHLVIINIFTDDQNINENAGPQFQEVPSFTTRVAVIRALKAEILLGYPFLPIFCYNWFCHVHITCICMEACCSCSLFWKRCINIVMVKQKPCILKKLPTQVGQITLKWLGGGSVCRLEQPT